MALKRSRSGSARGKSGGGRGAARSGGKASSRAKTGTTSKRRATSSAGARSHRGQTTRRGLGTQAAKITTDHDEIRRWAEERGGQPSCVRGTGDEDDVGILRIDFPDYSGEQSLQPISWDEFFEKFDERRLALVYQDETSGGQRSNFNKLIDREDSGASGRRRRSDRHGRSA